MLFRITQRICETFRRAILKSSNAQANVTIILPYLAKIFSKFEVIFMDFFTLIQLLSANGIFIETSSNTLLYTLNYTLIFKNYTNISYNNQLLSAIAYYH